MQMNTCMPKELHGLPVAVLDDFVKVLEASHAVQPKEQVLHRMAGLLSRGLAGEALVAVCPVCPDYAAEPSDGPGERYRYTFRGIGEGIGLVAGRLLESLPLYIEFFRRHNVDVRYLVAQGDFEAYSQATLARVGVSQAEFLRRMKTSGKHIESRLRGLPARVCFMTDFCGGESGWRALHAEMLCRLEKLREQPLPCGLRVDWEQVLAARRPLYERWIGARPLMEDYLPFLTHQAAEYVAMGEIAHKVSSNSFILACDHPAMAPFYGAVHRTPVVYLRRNYN